MKDIFRKIEMFALSELYAPILFLVVYGLVVLDTPVLAICFLLLVECAVCLASDDLVPMLLPLLLLFCVSFLCQEYFATDLLWLFLFALPCIPILIYRFVRGLSHLRIGPGLPALILVSLSLILGGIGAIPVGEYFAVGSLYHILALGPGMIFLYLLIKGSASLTRSYDVADKIAAAFYLTGLFLAFLVLRAYAMNFDLLYGAGEVENLIQEALPWRNIAANLSVICLPFVFYYARRHHPLHAIGACLLYLVMLASGSRGAALCGAVVILLGFVWLAWGRWRTALVLLGLLLISGALAFVFRAQIAVLFETFFGFHNYGSNGDYFVELDGFNLLNETRYKMLLRSLEDFLASPVFGRGVGAMNNTDIYQPPTAFQICWYHSLIPQIVGSLGILGILAYGYQFFVRLRLVFRAERTAYTGMLALGYIAILGYSMIDPGLFSPLPYAALAVLFAVLLEQNAGEYGTLTQNSLFYRILRLFSKKKNDEKIPT